MDSNTRSETCVVAELSAYTKRPISFTVLSGFHFFAKGFPKETQCLDNNIYQNSMNYKPENFNFFAPESVLTGKPQVGRTVHFQGAPHVLSPRPALPGGIQTEKVACPINPG